METGLVIIKAVGNQCNLRCRYCYVLPRTKNTIMSAQTLKQTIKSIAGLEPVPIYFWGGGEPLLAGRRFFEKVLNLQSIYCNISPVNSLQTNGLLIDKTWIDFIKRYNFQVGISWDGFGESARVMADNQTVGERVWKTIELCLNERLRFGVITVITQQNVKQLAQIAQILYSEGIKDLLFKPYIGPVTDLSLDSSEYAKAMCGIIDLWFRIKDNDWVIEPIYSFVRALSGDSTGIGCDLVNDCGRFLTIENNGDISCCDFIPQRFIFGNVQKTPPKEITTNVAYKQFVAKVKTRPRECANCSWQDICGGGCLHYRNFDVSSQEWREYILCGARKEIFSYYKQKLFSEAKNPK